ncbi:PREDICTED: thyroid transcription factor 1-associated protein 26 [Condylura cristata]|uniref:thyroid transcription factor 1-associated protein 26 n=1 Tax=Condylura cristata TaxID=143302 RepID=UPI00064327A6|nr:PREDICTED: thyroid transcription factor 1-associated protein 26 [Condylura cristata]
MAPARPAARWRRTGTFGTSGEDSHVGSRNTKVKQRTWRPNHAQAFVGSIREGMCKGRLLRVLRLFITIPKKNKKKTSTQKAQEEYERVQAKRAAKKQEFERRKKEREEAQKLYKKKKMEMFKILSKKTKKGQPNLNLQMEYLLKKIQEKN